MIQKIRSISEWMNEKGVPIPFARYNGRPSVSLSLLVISAAFVMVALIGSKTGVDFWQALLWHSISAVLYYNRAAKISKDGIELAASQPKEDNGQEGSNAGREESDDQSDLQQSKSAAGRSSSGRGRKFKRVR